MSELAIKRRPFLLLIIARNVYIIGLLPYELIFPWPARDSEASALKLTFKNCCNQPTLNKILLILTQPVYNNLGDSIGNYSSLFNLLWNSTNLYRCGTVLAQSPASCSDTSSMRHVIALLLEDVGIPPASELSMTASSFTAPTSFASSSDGDESGYEQTQYDAPTYGLKIFSYLKVFKPICIRPAPSNYLVITGTIQVIIFHIVVAARVVIIINKFV